MNQAVAKKLDEIIGALQTTSQAGGNVRYSVDLLCSHKARSQKILTGPVTPVEQFSSSPPLLSQGVASLSFTAHRANTASPWGVCEQEGQLAAPSKARLTAEISIPENDAMAHRIVIERLEFQGCCGVASEERRRPQPLAIDLELEFQGEPGPVSDNIHDVVDYAQITDRIVELGSTQECALLETLAEHMLTVLFTEFPVDRVKLWLRKLT